VAWRYDDDYVGWAPLSPTAEWNASVGFRYVSTDIPARNWCFVDRRRILDTNVRTRLVPEPRNVTLIQRTRDVTRFDVRRGAPINTGIDAYVVQRWTGRPVRRTSIVDVSAPSRGDRPASQGSLGMFRPRFRDDAADAPRPEQSQRVEPATRSPIVQQREYVQERQRLESSLATEQARLQREHAREERQASPDIRDVVRSRNDAERQAFQQHAEEQRQVLESRWQKNVARKPSHDQDVGKGKSHGRGHGRGHGDEDGGGGGD